MKSYAISKKSELEFISYLSEDSATHFFIGLKQDIEEKRDIFYDLLEKYEKYKISEAYPMIFHFVSSDMLDSVYNLKSISLNEQASNTMSN